MFVAIEGFDQSDPAAVANRVAEELRDRGFSAARVSMATALSHPQGLCEAVATHDVVIASHVLGALEPAFDVAATEARAPACELLPDLVVRCDLDPVLARAGLARCKVTTVQQLRPQCTVTDQRAWSAQSEQPPELTAVRVAELIDSAICFGVKAAIGRFRERAQHSN
jgi:hypothetical protein